MRYRLSILLLISLPLFMINREAYAIRPFVTDDARVVGDRLAQLETWLLGNRNDITHNILGAIGPTDWLEVTTGFAHGGVFDESDKGNGYSITGPIFQLKALAHEVKPGSWPGVAFAVGTLPPFGYGPFKPRGVGVFGYMAITESLFNDDFLFHANIGVTTVDEKTHWVLTTTSGFGFQARIIGGLHAVGEFYHGDPYDALLRTGASQFGFRYIVNDSIQFDGTVGSTFADNSEQWWTLGIRLVSDMLW
jgi:hypothetical protein